MLWDCKREALRGLGVNIGEEKQVASRHCYEPSSSIMEHKFLKIQTLRSTTDSKKPLIVGTQGAVAGIRIVHCSLRKS